MSLLHILFVLFLRLFALLGTLASLYFTALTYQDWGTDAGVPAIWLLTAAACGLLYLKSTERKTLE